MLEAVAKPRRWPLAVFLTWFGFGSGYLYVGRPKRALLAVATSILFLIIPWLGLGGWLARPWTIFILIGLSIVAFIGFAIDAACIAANSSNYAPRWYNRWWLYLGLAIAGMALGWLPDVAEAFSKKPVRSFSIPSSAMEPTLRVGDYAFADMRAFDATEPSRGDIVVFTLPRDASTIYVKRIVALPGEKVQMKSGILHIDGQAVPIVDAGTYMLDSPTEPKNSTPARLKRETLPNGVSHATLDLVDNGFYDNTPVYQVPPGHYFMMGDNRDNSTDSRGPSQFGYIPRANVSGRISWIYWSRDLSRIGTKPN